MTLEFAQRVSEKTAQGKSQKYDIDLKIRPGDQMTEDAPEDDPHQQDDGCCQKNPDPGAGDSDIIIELFR